jgi:hypothetical protein
VFIGINQNKIMINPKIFIGPMSKNIIDSIIEYSNENNIPIGIIPSRRQIENTGGYVNKWTTIEFCKYVREKSNNILLVRDHCGPSQGYIEDDGIDSFREDCKDGMFDVIHVDVWKKNKDYKSGLLDTVKFIQLGYKLNPNVLYEIGTEESIRMTTPEELDQLLLDLSNMLIPEIFSKIKYLVIQSGTALKGNENIGNFNQNRLIEMINVSKKYNLISKEHNGDYLTDELLSSKFKDGLDAINIAPEFGQIETKVILDYIINNKPELFEDFYKICLDSKRWVKWVSDDFNPDENKESIINISGHYVFSEPRFIELLNNLEYNNLEVDIKNSIKNKIKNIIEIIY